VETHPHTHAREGGGGENVSLERALDGGGSGDECGDGDSFGGKRG